MTTIPATIDRPVNAKALRQEWGISYGESQLLRLEREGKFPRRFKLGEGCRTNYWLASELSAWVLARAATRESKGVRA
jgi:predicted DNA-binding transcriptional regulator AlpA